MPRLVIARGLSMVLVALAALVLLSSAASAQPAGNLTLDPFRPALDSRGYLTVNGSQVLADRELSFGLGALEWARDLLRLDAGGKSYSIDDMITATLVATVGLRLGPSSVELGASLPLAIMSGARGPASPATAGASGFAIDGQGIGDLGLHAKLRLVDDRPGGRLGGQLGAALIASVYLPTVTARDRFLGEIQVVPQLVGVVDHAFGRARRFRLSLNGGIRLRRTVTFTDGDAGSGPGMLPVTNQAIALGSELPFGLGAAYAVAPQRFDLIGEVFGAVPLGAHQGYRALEALGGVKLYLAQSSFLTLGAGRGLIAGRGGNPDARAFIGIVFEPASRDRDGDGIPDEADRCPEAPEDFDGYQDDDGCPDLDNDGDGIPDEADLCPDIPEDRNGVEDEDGCPEGATGDRDGDGIPDNVDKCPDQPEDKDGFEDEDGCPDPDNDRDGILDVDDLCPNDPEDKDGFEDEDGCPDPDNDHDRIPDKDDKCPDEPESYNGYQDEDGCPDRSVVNRVEGGIEVLRPINFEYNSAVIKQDSYYLLDAVVATLNGNSDIELLEVRGHTDERGDDAYNLALSDRRAAAVVAYLVAHGVAASRLHSRGYGETQPIDPHHTPAAWAVNRRVEFVLRKRAGE